MTNQDRCSGAQTWEKRQEIGSQLAVSLPHSKLAHFMHIYACDNGYDKMRINSGLLDKPAGLGSTIGEDGELKRRLRVKKMFFEQRD